jgi:hypothetical protein
VQASRGKVARAEPVAALYEQGRVHHLGAFPQLEDQMCAFTSAFGNRKRPRRLGRSKNLIAPRDRWSGCSSRKRKHSDFSTCGPNAFRRRMPGLHLASGCSVTI